MWLDFYGLEINKDDKNKIKNIRVLNTESSKEEDFVTFAGLLRYFLNKNNFDSIGIEFTEFTNALSRRNNDPNDPFDPLLVYTKTYQLSLKSTLHDHKRYLEIETLKCFFYADSDANKKEGYDIVKYKNYLNKEIAVDFKPQKKQILEIRAQVWLEALNKYHV